MSFREHLLWAVAAAAGMVSAPALAERPRHPEGVFQVPRRDTDRAFQNMRQGRSMPLPELERRVLPFMGGADYLGPELNGDAYRFKFIQNGRVIWVDVDGQ